MFTQEELLASLGSPLTNGVVHRFNKFAHKPRSILDQIAREALSEHWGINNFALLKYLSILVPWSIEQGLFTQNSSQFYIAAGHLQTRYGTPLYLAFGRNREPGRQPFSLQAGGSRIAAPEFPNPPQVPAPPEIPRGSEIVMLHDHILGDHSDRLDFLLATPPVAQMCAVAGAIQWSLNRNLQMPYYYFGKMNYIVPLYLQSRENITLSPDCIAPIQINPDSLLVRTVLEPHMPYVNARVAVRRHDSLPSWLLDSWARYAETALETDEPEE
jgi:hypothetical protein